MNLNKLIYCISRKNLRMEQQIIILNIVLILILMFITGMIILVQKTLIFMIIENSSTDIFTRQEHASLVQASSRAYSYIKYKHLLSINQLERIDDLFLYIEKEIGKYQLMDNLSLCLNYNDYINSKILSTLPEFCYWAQGSQDKIYLPENDSTIFIYNQTTKLLNLFTGVRDFSAQKLILYSDYSQYGFLGVFPPAYLKPTYYANQRSWFINHIEMQQQYPNGEYFFSPVYQIFNQSNYQISLTISIKSLDNVNIGVMENLIPLYDPNVQNIPFNIMLINNNGQIVLSGTDYFSLTNKSLYIFNESITGFNSTDWQQMQQFSQNNQITSNCSNILNSFCLFNKLLNLTVQINSTFFQQEQFTLVVFSNVSYDYLLKEQFTQLTNKLSSQIIETYIIIVFGSIVMIAIQVIIVHLLFLPLSCLMKSITIYIKQIGNNVVTEIFKIKNLYKWNKKKQNHSFSALSKSIFQFQDHLFNRMSHKNQYCQYIENIQYNKKLKGIYEYHLEIEEASIQNNTIIEGYKLFTTYYNQSIQFMQTINTLPQYYIIFPKKYQNIVDKE